MEDKTITSLKYQSLENGIICKRDHTANAANMELHLLVITRLYLAFKMIYLILNKNNTGK